LATVAQSQARGSIIAALEEAERELEVIRQEGEAEEMAAE